MAYPFFLGKLLDKPLKIKKKNVEKKHGYRKNCKEFWKAENGKASSILFSISRD